MKVSLMISALATVLATATRIPPAFAFQWPPASAAQNPTTVTGSAVSNCGTSSDIWHLDYIKITPDPPQRGQPLLIDVKGNLDEKVDKGAYAQVTVKLGIIKLLDSRLDLCDEAKNLNVTCPIEKGEQQITRTVDLPNELPPGKYKIHVDAFNFDDKHVACIDADFQL
ncbi:Phosphatidylglycerol/phosphatidylinositol transfer protein [Borealophlyctis nickersoniae]|nr:Phosphatidylglycerol/phosphatidylinositol transfer protein [Borealophlyctis nickersoniae]